MKKMHGIGISLVVLLAFAGKHSSAGDARIIVCHVDESGDLITVNASPQSLPAHVSHGDPAPKSFFADADGDGVGAGPPIEACESPGAGFVEISGDAFPDDGSESGDNDEDGVGNHGDTDDDNDGVSDAAELAAGTDPLDPDTDGDGVNDGHDVFATDPNRTLTHLIGDTGCAWGAADCNPCVNGVSAQLAGLQDDYQEAGRIRFDGYAYPTDGYLLNRINDDNAFALGKYEHVQSIGRIAGIGNQEYMVFTHSTRAGEPYKEGALAVVRMGAGQNTSGHPFDGMPDGDGPDQNTSNRTVARTFAGNNHPGGLSVLGHYVYVAQWCQDEGNPDGWCDASSEAQHGTGFSIYDVSKVDLNADINSSPPIDLDYHHVYDEAWMKDEDGKTFSTASVAAVKQSSGHYLVALGRSGGREYGFYTATDPAGPFTFSNSSTIGLWGENANIVTECETGDLYMFQIEGYGESSDVDKVHLYKLVLTDDGVGFAPDQSRTFTCRGSEIDGAGDWCHFDAGAGIYVTPDRRLVLYATEWHQTSAGNIRLVEFR